MSKAHHRKKQPEAVRHLLLEVAAGLCLEKGTAGITLDAVAVAAGVSKGGLLHHFPSKAALLDGLLDDLMDRLDAAIHQAVIDDPEPRGRYTRAYLKVCFVTGGMAEEGRWKAMTIALLGEPQLRARWRRWVEERSELYAGTDSSVECELVRFAVDGLWLASVLESQSIGPEREQALMRRLDQLTRS
ncbi:TetR/AcrR family transcriptional regulator [Rhizobium sp. ARZ01]|uniref:TetR/AcrR family transcriptional regulator n=1 Tax=Rhizobium sp. ARZ01 TaxID=2769313 RepID=UPI00177A96B6|nr:TetR/AcrR family transcriptional regulator [Rhizobium sp. ARZ01]MBD9373296.1 TetR/AcrR family transcriptional regulator [Rhizobium sp. ARZ01]